MHPQQPARRPAKSDMRGATGKPFYLAAIALEDFLKEPPFGFTVEKRGSGYRFVKYDPESCCVFIDDVQTAKGKVIFQHSPGRSVKVRSPGEYTQLRKRLTSKLIFLLVSACGGSAGGTTKRKVKVLKHYIVVINGNNPFIKWDLEQGLDHTISSVAGESYRVKVDVKAALKRWVEQEHFVISVGNEKVTPVWQNTSFAIKYSVGALFDFPFWLGFSKRSFSIGGKVSYFSILDKQKVFEMQELFSSFFCPSLKMT
uniref:Mesenteric estrogen-dependent adipogenesis protein-like n=1 Tax=Erpetoichthys calabaricus TaxID=27687 RepID=A0A8C4RSM5_ERPCA